MRVRKMGLKWNNKMSALRNIFILCVFRWAENDDERYALAAKTVYQVLSGPYRKECLNTTIDLVDICFSPTEYDCDELKIYKSEENKNKAIMFLSNLPKLKTGLFAVGKAKMN